MLDGAFDIWLQSEIPSSQDLYVDNHFASFEHLLNKFDIRRSHLDRYLQSSNPPTSLLEPIFKFRTNMEPITGRIYNLLPQHCLTTSDRLESKREEDLNEQIPDAVWQKIV